jgi:hypothetical protein
MYFVQAVMLLVIMPMWAGAASDQTTDKHYLNYGYIMKNVGVTHVSNAKAIISLAADLPARNISSIDRSVCRGLRDRCEKVMSLAYAYRQLHNRAIQKLRDTLDYVYELLDFEETVRSKRSWTPGWMTQLLSQATGLADQRDLAVLQKSIKRFESTLAKGIHAFSESETHVSQIVNLQNERLENLQRIAKLNTENSQMICDKLVETSFFDDQQHRLAASALEHMHNFTLYLADVENLYHAVQLISINKLPSFLVPHDVLKRALNHLSEFLAERHSHLTITHTDLHYYYKQANFFVFRRRNRLYIHLECPLSSFAPLFQIYTLETVPLAIPATPNVFSSIDTSVKLIGVGSGFYFWTDQISAFAHPSSDLDLSTSTIQLRDIKIPSCVVGLIQGDINMIKRFCAYQIIQNSLPAQLIKLSPNRVFVSNVSSLLIQCDAYTEIKTHLAVDQQVVLDVPPGCDLLSGQLFVPRTMQTSNLSDTFESSNSTFYLTNYPYLSEWFSDDQLQGILGDTYVNKTHNISLPALQIQAAKLNTLFAADTKAKFALSDLINATKQDQSIFTSLSHYILQKLIDDQNDDSSFKLFSFKDWSILFMYAIVILDTMLVLYFAYKLRQFRLVLAVAIGPRLVQALDLHYGPTVSASTRTPDAAQISEFVSMIAELIPVDFTLLALVIIIVLIAITLLVRHCYMQRLSKPQAYLCVQIGNIRNCVNLEWAKMIHPPEFYALDVKFALKPGDTIRYASAVLLARTFKLTDVKMTLQHKHVQLSVDIAVKHKVSRYVVKQIRRITSGDYFIAAVMKDSKGRITSCFQLRPYVPDESQNDRTDFTSRPSFAPLYPKIDYQ